MKSFQIIYAWTPLPVPYRFDEHDYADISSVELGLEKFLCAYTGHFTLSIDTLQIPLYLETDFYAVFEDLPDVLEMLITNGELGEIQFFEQGSGFNMQFRRDGQRVQITFTTTEAVGSLFAQLPTTPMVISLASLLTQWSQFVNAVLEAVITCCPTLHEDKSYLAYQQRMSRLIEGLYALI
jgi:hypothetical protein